MTAARHDCDQRDGYCCTCDGHQWIDYDAKGIRQLCAICKDWRKEGRTMPTRYAITHESRRGYRTLTLANQGRNHFDSWAEAEAALDAFRPGLARVLTPDEWATLGVRAVECYAHGDAVATVYPSDADVAADVATATAPDSLQVPVAICPRCGASHELPFVPLAKPATIEGSRHTHWATCPTRGEPVFLCLQLINTEA